MNLVILATNWWNELGSASKTQMCDTNTELLDNKIRRWETLNSDEIVTLYNNLVILKSTSAINQLTDEQIDMIIRDLDDYGSGVDKYCFGLPKSPEDLINMRSIVRGEF